MSKEMILCGMPHLGSWHYGAWRLPNAQNDFWNLEMWREYARRAEAAKFDAVFYADHMSLWPVVESVRHHTAKVGGWDALMLGAVTAEVTEKIGIICTGHTEYQSPYPLARQLAVLDHISGGRAGWNIVTSSGEWEVGNFREGAARPTEERYERAEEFADAVTGLWDSWEDDAYLIDKESGVFYDPEKLHQLNHRGKYYHVDGPLNVMRPPQGHPVLAQAGSSGPGTAFAAKTAELVFTPLSGQAAIDYANRVRSLAAENGRDPSKIRVLEQLLPVVAETDEAAEVKWAEMQSLQNIEVAMSIIQIMLGVDLSGLELDEPVPELEDTNNIRSYREAIMNVRRPDGSKPTLREIVLDWKGPGTVVGSPKTVADWMIAEVDSGACDGFVTLGQAMPDSFNDFFDMVVPELQRRGRFRTEYPEGKTFRERIGLERPANRFVESREQIPA